MEDISDSGPLMSTDEVGGMHYVRAAIWCVFCPEKTPAEYIVNGSSVCAEHR